MVAMMRELTSRDIAALPMLARCGIDAAIDACEAHEFEAATLFIRAAAAVAPHNWVIVLHTPTDVLCPRSQFAEAFNVGASLSERQAEYAVH
jgi:hypothetical protein